MTIRPFYAFLIALFFTTMVTFAQDQPQGEEKHQPPSADEIVSKMQSQCNLTSDQITAVTPIIQKYIDQRQELRQSMQDGSADKDSIRSQMKELMENENQELGQVLSADQMSQCKSVLSPGRHKRGNTGGSWGGGSNGEGGNNSGGSAGSEE